MRVAIVHDWLVTYAGAERVLEQLVQIYPDCDLFALIDFLKPADRAFIQGKKVKTSFIQELPFSRNNYRRYLPLMPLAIEQFDLSAYDLVISSSHAVAKGVITGPSQLHISYVHSPMRYAWDLQHQYLREAGLDQGLKSGLARYMLHRMRIWDTRTAAGVDVFVANSRFIARRIEKAYRRSAEVIYPPVNIDFFTPGGDRENYYVTASRMVPYKRMPLIVEAFNEMSGRKLVVIGDGPDFKKIQRMAGSNVHLLRNCSANDVRDRMRRACAFVYAAEEDFGIAPVEAQACGTPVLAYGKGGVSETVRDSSGGATGVFFNEQSATSIIDAVERFERIRAQISPADCRQNAERFSPQIFRDSFTHLVQCKLRDFRPAVNT